MSSKVAETFQFHCPDGTVLRGVFSDPGAKGPVGIFLHGFRSTWSGRKGQAVWAHAHTQGYSWLSFDLRGHGSSDGDLADLRISVLRQDLEAILAWLHPRPVLLVGSSLGGWLAALVARRCPVQVGGLVLIAPAFNFLQQIFATLPEAELAHWARTGSRHFADPYSDQSYLLGYDLLADAEREALHPPLALSCPVAIVHGTEDEVVPARQSEDFMAGLSAPRKDLIWIPDGDHRLHEGIAPVLQQIDRYWTPLASR